MKKLFYALILAIFIAFSACELLEETVEKVDEELTKEEVISGLKKALELGTDTATSVLGMTNGYFGDALVKIPLPPDVENVRNVITGNSTLNLVASGLNLDQKFDDVITAINHSAENAAKEAGPIFKNAISDMSLNDAWDILNGAVPNDTLKSSYATDFDSIAATKYFMNTTYSPLVGLFAPKINNALDEDISVLGFSALDAWNTLTSTYNTFMSDSKVKSAISVANLLGQSIDLPTSLNEDLGSFCTGKALDGLYLKVGDEEKKIRKNPYQWAVDIIQKVFGSIFEE